MVLVPAVILATAGLLLVHEPPTVACVSVVVEPKHTLAVPVIGDIGLTVTPKVAIQPVANVYLIRVLPNPTPLITPFEEPIVATAKSALLHVPPETPLPKLTGLPIHNILEPVIVDGTGNTVIVVVAIQPVVNP